MGVSPFQQPDFTTDTATQYKTNLDDAIAVFLRMAGAFSPQAQDTPDMTVKVNAGHVFDGTTLTEVAAQNTGTITAPVTDDRIDRVVISATDGTVSVITGTEDPSPSAPAITEGNLPVAQVYLTPSHTEIANSDLTDERSQSQRASRFYAGWVDDSQVDTSSPGSTNGLVAPPGFTVYRSSTGNYVLNHNLGITGDVKNLICMINPGIQTVIGIGNFDDGNTGANRIIVNLRNPETAAAVNENWQFLILDNN